MAGSGAFRLLSAPLRALGARWVALVEPELTRDPACAVDADLLARVKPHHRRAAELAMSDLCGRRHEAILRLPAAVERALCARVLSDPRDLPIFLVFLQVAAFHTLSSVLQITLLPRDDMRGLWWGVPQFLVGWIVLGQRFILAMHYAAHRPIFSPKKLGRWAAGALNAVPQTLLSNLYGMPAGAYYVHHCIMHHQANNVFPYDISSTMPYRRDSPLHFLMYVANFMVHTLLYLPYYALSKRRFGLAAGCLACLGAYLAAYPLLYRFHPVWFVNTLGHSFWLGPFALMLGNWSQHVFVDPQRPTSNYGLATNHLGAPFNMLSFNDGYHITHHVSSITHWSEVRAARLHASTTARPHASTTAREHDCTRARTEPATPSSAVPSPPPAILHSTAAQLHSCTAQLHSTAAQHSCSCTATAAQHNPFLPSRHPAHRSAVRSAGCPVAYRYRSQHRSQHRYRHRDRHRDRWYRSVAPVGGTVVPEATPPPDTSPLTTPAPPHHPRSRCRGSLSRSSTSTRQATPSCSSGLTSMMWESPLSAASAACASSPSTPSSCARYHAPKKNSSPSSASVSSLYRPPRRRHCERRSSPPSLPPS